MALQEYLAQIEHALAPVRHVMKPILSDPLIMGFWALPVVVSVGTLWWDIRNRNQALRSLMKGVWKLTFSTLARSASRSTGIPVERKSATTRCGDVDFARRPTVI